MELLRRIRRRLGNIKRKAYDYAPYGKAWLAVKIKYLQRRLFGRPMLNKAEQRQYNIIISLTSYGYRITDVHKAIQSIFCQSYLPDKVILYLGEDADDIAITKELATLQKHGLEIKRHYPDIKSHKKYYFAMQEYPDDIIITIDDDLLYEPELLRTLVDSYQANPQAVSARRVHRMLKRDGVLLPYPEWNFVYQQERQPTMALFSTSGAGTLYPPHCLHQDLFDVQAITELSLPADDVWLKAMQLRQGTEVVWAGGEDILVIWGSQDEALFYLNLNAGENDRCIKRIEDRYGMSFADYAISV